MSRDSIAVTEIRLQADLVQRAPLNSNKNNNNRNRGGIAGNKSLALHRCCLFPIVKLGKVEFSRLRFNPLAVVTEQTSPRERSRNMHEKRGERIEWKPGYPVGIPIY